MPFKNYEKCFLFHLKSSFRSQDIQIICISNLPSLSLCQWSKINLKVCDIINCLYKNLKVTSATKQFLKICHLRHRLRIFFLFCRKVMFHSEDIFFSEEAFLTIPWFRYQLRDVLMSISTWDKVHYFIYLLVHNTLTLFVMGEGRFCPPTPL